ncbi:Zinc transporter ZIP9 [Schistosoma japonicum]|nr:Zinc transporter ZIP9 [Schistosoma japonicum]
MLYLTIINVLLFIGCYTAGCIPISFRLSASKIRILTVFGAGLLLGAALVVVIPEGIAAIYNSHKHQHINPIPDNQNSLYIPNSRKLNMVDIVESPKNEGNLQSAENKNDNDGQINPQNNNNDNDKHPALNKNDIHDGSDNSNTSHIHQKVGIALLIGYLFMLLIDQMSYTVLKLACCQSVLFNLRNLCCRFILYIPLINRFHSSTNAGGSNVNITNSMNSSNLIATSTSQNNINNLTEEAPTISNASNYSPTGSIQPANHKGFIVTCGLIIHSLADGLAIGSAFAINQIQLELILFLAIILHKIPAAFGLSCFLLHEGFTRDQIRLHMIAFSFSTPLASFVTYFFLSVSSKSSVETDIGMASTGTGFALLLSGGTFLYVAATHILPELISSSGTNSIINLNNNNNNAGGSGTSNLSKQIRIPEVSVLTDSLDNNTSGRVSSSNYGLYTVDSSHESIIMYNYPKSNDYLINSVPHVNRLSMLEIIVLITGTVMPILLSSSHSH